MTAGSDGADGKETPWVYRISRSLWANQGTFWSPAISGGRGVVSSSRKNPVTHSLSRCLCQCCLTCSSSCFGFLSVSLSLFLFVLTLTLLLFCPFKSSTVSLSISTFHLSSWHSHPVITVHPFLYLNQISISFSSGPRLPTPSLFLSVSQWFWGFAVKCVGGERKKKYFLCRKMITYHFSVLVPSLLRWICCQQCHRVSLEMFFYSISRSQWGHAAGTTPWPDPLTVSIPNTVSSTAPRPIYLTPQTMTLWSRS